MKDYAVYFRLLKTLATKVFDHKKTIPLRMEKYLELSSEGEDLKHPLRSIVSGYGNTISSELLRYLINNETLFLNRVSANSDIRKIEINAINRDGSIGLTRSISIADFVTRIELAYSQGLISEEEYHKTEKLRECTSYVHLLEEYEDETLHFKCHSGEYTIPVKAFFDILSLDQDQLKTLICSSTIAGIPKEEFISSMKSFFRMRRPHEKYLIPTTMFLNKRYLESVVDTFAIDKFSSYFPEYVEEIAVDEQLITTILASLPKDFTPLEQAYYVYYQLCKTFTYDEEWYATSGLGENCNNHRNIDYISELTSENNEVVCHDFNAIYSKFLERLGISYNYLAQSEYGKGHAFLEFAAGKFFVSADAVTSILTGDLPKAKLGESLIGFTLKNQNKDTINEFQQSLAKVEEYIKNIERQQQTFASYVEQYQKQRMHDIKLSPVERRDIFFDRIRTSSLPVTDTLAYIKLLEKNLFPAFEQNYCQSYFVADAKPPKSRKKSATVAVIICFNPAGNIRENSADNEYYTYIPTEGISKINKEALTENIKSGRFSSISNYIREIPGIDLTASHTATSSSHK